MVLLSHFTILIRNIKHYQQSIKNMNSYKYYHKLTTNIICFLLAYQTNYAQILHPQLAMSSMGSMGNTSGLSAAINFKSNANCIDVQSGIAVLNGSKGFGEFVVNCTEKQSFNTLGVNMYPNPVISKSKIKFTNTPPLTENFNITIWTAEGTLVKSLQATGYHIFQGLLLNISDISPGTYVLKIESPAYIEALKFIKTN